MATPILGKKDLDKAMALRERLSEDYKPFFKNMKDFYTKNLPGSEDGVLVGKTVPKIERALVLIARIFLGRGVTASTQRELDQLNQYLSDIEEAKNYVVQKAAEHVFAKEALSSAIELSGISPEELSLSVKLAKPGLIRRLIKRGGGFKGLMGAGLLSQILAPLLGPLFVPVMAMVGAGAGYEAFKGLGGLRGLGKGRGVLKWLKGLGGMGGMGGDRGGLGGGFGMPAAETVPQMQPSVPFAGPTPRMQPSVPPAGPMSWLRDYQGRFIGGKGDVRAIQQAAMPIWFFFDKLAYRARWTKEVLATLKGKPSGVEGRGFGLLGGIGDLLKLGGVGVALAYTVPKVVKLWDLINERIDVGKNVAEAEEKADVRKRRFVTAEVGSRLGAVKGMNASPERKHALRLQYLKSVGHREEYEAEKRRVEKLVESGMLPKSVLEERYPPRGAQSLATAATIPGTPMATPEIVVPPTPTTGEGAQYNQKVIDGLEGIKNEVKESGKKGVGGSPITGPYDSLADPLLKGLNSSGADFLPNYLNR